MTIHHEEGVAKGWMALADAVCLIFLGRAQISYALLPRVLRYVPLLMHARVVESMRHHESALLHAENGRCWRSHTHQNVASSMVARAHKHAMIARREHRFSPPSTLVGHQCCVQRWQDSRILNRRRRAKKSRTVLTH